MGRTVFAVEASNARIVVVDSIRTVVRKAQGDSTETQLQGFVQRLALHLTSWQATTFLIGEYVEGELRDNPVFTVADGLLWLYQSDREYGYAEVDLTGSDPLLAKLIGPDRVDLARRFLGLAPEVSV